MGELILKQIDGVPLIKSGDDIAKILFETIQIQHINIQNSDILAVTSKIISKAEGRFVNLQEIIPSKKAKSLAKRTDKDPRLAELILSESSDIVRANRRALIVEHKLGFICANAGVDHSNVLGTNGDNADWFLLLPKSPDISAKSISNYFYKKTSKSIGVIIIDSHGRPWRKGTVGVIIGTSKVPALVDLRGKPDLFGYHLKVSEVAAADELAGAASLMMGQADERIPAVYIKGFPYQFNESHLGDLIRPRITDLFR
jgi:coenzyme F420-0:L-glutamate ligase/coenzyme F420-1:gamma-L-glutamate ligase